MRPLHTSELRHNDSAKCLLVLMHTEPNKDRRYGILDTLLGYILASAHPLRNKLLWDVILWDNFPRNDLLWWIFI